MPSRRRLFVDDKDSLNGNVNWVSQWLRWAWGLVTLMAYFKTIHFSIVDDRLDFFGWNLNEWIRVDPYIRLSIDGTLPWPGNRGDDSK